MSATVSLSPSLRPLKSMTPRCLSRHSALTTLQNISFSTFEKFSLSTKSLCFHGKIRGISGKFGLLHAWSEAGPLHELDDSPVSIQLEPISSESQFDRIIAEAQQLEESVIVVWMASWCRKCIYLKPKLEKLAADYHPRLRFYCVDVNSVPHKLVAHAGVTLWKDGEKQVEVIGGHKAYFVVNEVRQMIENDYTA